MNGYVISIMSQDRVGIVADVSGAIKKLGGNLEDVSQSVMRGYFTMIVLATFPQKMDEENLRAELHSVKGLSQFEIGLLPYVEAPAPVPVSMESTYVLMASGPDRAGLVYSLSSYLREKGINILDLTTKFDQGNYIMVYQITLPAGTDVVKFKRSVKIAMEAEGLNVELRNEAIFHKTNEI